MVAPAVAAYQPVLQPVEEARTARIRAHAQWFAWIRQTLGGDVNVSHLAAEAALDAPTRGEDPAAAAQMVVATTPAGTASPFADLETRSYAEWFLWAQQHLGGTAEAQHQAAAAAMDALRQGADTNTAAEAARRGEPATWAPPSPAAQQGQPAAAELARSSIRIAMLLLVAPFAYFFWWEWQVMALARKEGFPRARAFWWLLVPFYGWAVLKRTLDDLAAAESRTTGTATLSPPVIIALLIGSAVVARFSNQVTNGYLVLAMCFVANGLTAIGGYMVQSSTNRYLDGRYGQLPRRGLSVAEVIAALIGLAYMTLVVIGALAG